VSKTIIQLIIKDGPPKQKSESKLDSLCDKVQEYIDYCLDTDSEDSREFEYLTKLNNKLKNRKLTPDLASIKKKLDKFFSKNEEE
jgi:hypothetical protein